MKNIFVGNLGFRTTEEEIRSLFQAHGTVERVTMVTDRYTGLSRGFCFVEMATDDEAQRAIAAVSDKELSGRKLNVNEARPRTGGGGGGGAAHREDRY